MHPPRLQTDFSRRRFLRLSAAATAAALLGWRFLGPTRGGALPTLTSVSSREGLILAAVYATVTGETDARKLSDAVGAMDVFLGHLSRRERWELRAALTLVEHSPLLFEGFLPRFTKLDPLMRARCLEGFRTGALWRRPVFSGLKELSYLIHYTRPAQWSAIGYQGPLVSAEARPAAERYRAMLAPTGSAPGNPS